MREISTSLAKRLFGSTAGCAGVSSDFLELKGGFYERNQIDSRNEISG
jgi:hypothetical protein